MSHKYHNYTDTAELEDVSRTPSNLFRYALMLFRPAGTLIICILLTIVVAIPCVLILITSKSSSIEYAVSMAIVTGVFASGLVSISLEMCNNYRHNRKRFVVLNYYLYMVSSYEQFVIWSSRDGYEEYREDAGYYFYFQETGKVPQRLLAIAEVILIIEPPVDEALENGREYLSIKEMKYATRAKDAAENIAEITKQEIFKHMKNHKYSFCDCLDDEYKRKIMDFSENVGIQITDENLESVVCDYMLSNLEEMDEDVKQELVAKLDDFDFAMHKLQKEMRFEPVVYENLIPFEERLKKMEEKFRR